MNLLVFIPVLLLQIPGLPAPDKSQPVTSLSFDAKEFSKAFNAAADRPRLVLIFSPT